MLEKAEQLEPQVSALGEDMDDVQSREEDEKLQRIVPSPTTAGEASMTRPVAHTALLEK